ncbi:MAG TPA: phosphoribosylformylglycinamidine cyclo-ligase [Thermoplasmata archaeon]|nr:phosphoribosylformylglycinamidine cyclo-ligase [Thermoplasmata archaeon]
MPKRVPLTYAASGVDVGIRAQALAALLGGVRYRPPPDHGRPVDLAGHFAGLVRLGRETVALTTDTVGTKVLLAEELRRWEEVGEDIVGVNVNDLAAVGARPAALVDTILCARPDDGVFAGIGRGLDRGLRRAGCALVGGETAVVPDLVSGFDLGGTALGFFPRGRRPVTGERIRPGDVILGIPSTGFHANGYTLVRRLLREESVDLDQPRPGGRGPVGLELLRPTRIYSDAADAIADRPEVHGLVHLSGGGVRNFVRLQSDVEFRLDAWPEPPGLFGWVQALGPLSDHEMFGTFNMGIGFAVVVSARGAGEVLRRLARAGARDAQRIGRVAPGRGVSLPGRSLAYAGYA